MFTALFRTADAVADLRDQRIDEHHRVDRLQRPVLPLPHLLQRPVGDPRDRVMRQLHPRRLPQVPGDIPHASSPSRTG